MASRPASLTVDTLRETLKSQYHAELAMLRDAIEKCPPAAWSGTEQLNQFWQIAYHAIYIGDMYLRPNEAAFRPWREHQGGTQNPDGIAGPPDPASTLPLIPNEYSKSQVLEYLAILDGQVGHAVDAIDLTSPESGFSWYKISKLEHQFVNIRHLQHHTAQLADRVRASAGLGVRWVGATKKKA